jgi:cobalt-zinc-cadmium efflux system protein
VDGHQHGTVGTVGAVDTHRTRLAIALAISVTILVAQVVGAIWTGSLALLVDTAHVLTDTGGLAIALLAARLAARPATPRRTWGLRRTEVLAATAQASVLLAVGLYVLVEGVHRLVQPPEVASAEMIVFGVIGLIGNVAAVAVLAGSRGATFTTRAAFLEVVNDALGSLAVIIAAVVMTLTGWARADAVVALLIGALILPRTVSLLRDTVNVLLESTPRGLDLDAVRGHILALPHVRAVHDLHASQIATGLPVLTAHVVLDDDCFHDGHALDLLDQLQACVAKHFDVSVEHSTFQLEPRKHRDHEYSPHD